MKTRLALLDPWSPSQRSVGPYQKAVSAEHQCRWPNRLGWCWVDTCRSLAEVAGVSLGTKSYLRGQKAKQNGVELREREGCLNLWKCLERTSQHAPRPGASNFKLRVWPICPPHDSWLKAINIMSCKKTIDKFWHMYHKGGHETWSTTSLAALASQNCPEQHQLLQRSQTAPNQSSFARSWHQEIGETLRQNQQFLFSQ